MMIQHKFIDQLEKLIEIGIALSSEKDANRLLEKILMGAKSITAADGGTIYTISGDRIKMELVHSDSLGLRFGGNFEKPIEMPDIPIYMEDGSPNLHNVVSCSYHKDETINIVDAYNNEEFDFSGTKELDLKNHYRSKSFLSVPLKNHENVIIGVLQLINAIDHKSGEVIGFDSVSQHITEALASQAAIVLTKQHLIADLEKMFESLIQLTATAIDDKSPYTGGHCRRVPELTMMLAEAAHKTEHGYLKDFAMTDADRYELMIAGWLHDCGKITTPEYVVDKASKLETIYDRIDLIETRFEVVKREKEIEMLKQKIAALEQGETLESAVEQDFTNALTKIDSDLQFIQQCNRGGEAMSQEDQHRILCLQKKTWSFRNRKLPLLSNDEVHHLMVPKGTLTDEEREVINHHIVATIAMLEKIPFPRHLKNVPEYAGGHHERMDGMGYPRGLVREEMSVQARVMAIADIFEALTARDRPYKQGMKLSEALSILSKMKEENHIDPDLYDAFINEKVYLQYAEKFLDASQIDID